MNRRELETFIADEYAAKPEYLWEGDNITAAFRHAKTHKWFCLAMRIPENKLGFKTDELIDVINVKLDPDLIQELITSHPHQIFPAYHMNKKHWVTILLGDSANSELTKALINDSFGLTL